MTVLCNTQDGHFDIDLKEVSSLKGQLVEAGGVEPPSENTSSGTSPGADGYLHSRAMTQAVMLHGGSFIVHAGGKAYSSHVHHLDHAQVRLVVLPGWTAADQAAARTSLSLFFNL